MTYSSEQILETKTSVLPVYVINLDVDTQRLFTMQAQLDSLGLNWQRIPAVDGGRLSSEVLQQENRRARRRNLSAGEISLPERSAAFAATSPRGSGWWKVLNRRR